MWGSPQLTWDCDCRGDRCANPLHHDFWHHDNWAFGRAPARWVHNDRSEDRRRERERYEREGGGCNAQFITDSLSVELWVPDCCVPDDAFLATNLWYVGGGHVWNDASRNVEWWRREEAVLLAERDPILNLRESADEAHWLAGAFPA